MSSMEEIQYIANSHVLDDVENAGGGGGERNLAEEE